VCTLPDVRKLDPDDPRPPYRQIVAVMRTEIAEGTLSPGDKLPSYTELAAEFGVSVGVIKRAFAELRDQGLIVIRQGQGSYVRTEPNSGAEWSSPILEDLSIAVTRELEAETAPDFNARLREVISVLRDLDARIAAIEAAERSKDEP
jgi:DNA-binding GntR family transcriptional regulator